jgi:D-alanyl-D-alanine carboxypeptidase
MSKMHYPSYRLGSICRLVGSVSLVSLLVLRGLAVAQPLQGGSNSDAITAISSAFCEDMKVRHVLGPKGPVGCERLKLVKFSYFGFDGNKHDDGEVVVMDAVAVHVLRIFVSLRNMHFPIAKARPMNNYEGDDNASMRDNNSSAFNDRNLTGGDSISLHAYGLAIDLNPAQNPYLVRSGGILKIEPPAGIEYINRLNERPWRQFRPGMAEAVISIFADNGFLIWGGYWDEPIDYQHFQVGRKTAERLAKLRPSEAAEVFSRIAERFRTCQQKYPANAIPRPKCIIVADPTAN